MRFRSCFTVLCVHILLLICQYPIGSSADTKTLLVGDELKGETLPLRSGRRFYRLAGLKNCASYEVKISYPASIPASFDIRIEKEVNEFWVRRNRRLLNTEKLIFDVDGHRMESEHGELYALVTVEAAGVVAKRGLLEREFIEFNIVCDELLLKIPYKAWWVVIAALLCLVLAFVIPCFLPIHMLLNNQNSQLSKVDVIKAS